MIIIHVTLQLNVEADCVSDERSEMINSKELIEHARKQGHEIELRTLRDYTYKGLLPQPIAKKRQKEQGQGGGMIAFYPDKATAFLEEILTGRKKGLSLQEIRSKLYSQEYKELYSERVSLSAITKTEPPSETFINGAVERFLRIVPEIKKMYKLELVIPEEETAVVIIPDFFVEDISPEDFSTKLAEYKQTVQEQHRQLALKSITNRTKKEVDNLLRLLKESYGLSRAEKRRHLLIWLIEEQKGRINEACSISDNIGHTLVLISGQYLEALEVYEREVKQGQPESVTISRLNTILIPPKRPPAAKTLQCTSVSYLNTIASILLTMKDNYEEHSKTLKELNETLAVMEYELRKLQQEVNP